MLLIVISLISRKRLECDQSRKIGIARSGESLSRSMTQGAEKGGCRLNGGFVEGVVRFSSSGLVADKEGVEKGSSWVVGIVHDVGGEEGVVSEVNEIESIFLEEDFIVEVEVCKQFKKKACSAE